MTAHRAFGLLAASVMLSSLLGLAACGGSTYGVAVDTTTKNILYVSNDNATAHQISVFDNAANVVTEAPNRTITPTVLNVNQPVGGISLDATHDVLYVAPGVAGNGIMVFSSASTANGPIAPSKTL